jgi:hypothetical protein
VRHTLDETWQAYETLESRIIFWDTAESTTTWIHPDPHYDGPSYAHHPDLLNRVEPVFEALSYTWGSETSQVAVDILPIFGVWIDALFINQQDLLERSQQVNRMGDIFQSARRVVVCLGLARQDSSLALRMPGHIGTQLQVSKDYFAMPSSDCAQPHWFKVRDAAQFDSDPRTWYATRNLLCRPWFGRLWISLICTRGYLSVKH